MICAVVLNWNSPDDTIACIRSLQSVSVPEGEEFRVICVDNGSTDGSRGRISAALPGTELLCTGRNLGYAGGNNAGIKRAMELGAGYIWILNNDTEADANALTGLYEALKDGEYAASGSLILLASDRSTIWFAGGKYHRWHGGTSHFLEGKRYEPSMDALIGKERADFLSGCSFLITAGALKTAGMLDDRLFLLFEEADLFARLRKAGLRWTMAPASVIYHKVSASPLMEGHRIYYFLRNMLRISLRYYLAWFPVVLLRSVRWPFLPAVLRHKKNLKPVLDAYRDFFTGRYGPYEK